MYFNILASVYLNVYTNLTHDQRKSMIIIILVLNMLFYNNHIKLLDTISNILNRANHSTPFLY